MEIVTRALVTELNSRPDHEGVIITSSNEKSARPSTSEVPPSSISSCDPGSPSQAAIEAKASTRVEVLDSTADLQFEATGWRGSAGSWNLFSEASKCQFEWIWLSGCVGGGFVCDPFLDT